MWNMIRWGIFTILFVFLGTGGFLAIAGHRDTIRKSDVCVVLGNKVNTDGSLSPRLRSRLVRAVELAKSGDCRYIVVSGGLGKEGFYEADKMKEFLVTNGIADTSVIVDNNGINTYQTAVFTKRYLQQNGYSSVIVVTQYYHIFRTVYILRKLGIKNISTAHARHYELMDIFSIPREIVALVKYWIHY